MTAVQILNNHALPFFEEHGNLQPEPPAPRPRHGGENPVPRLQEGEPEAPHPEEVSEEGGEDRSLKR